MKFIDVVEAYVIGGTVSLTLVMIYLFMKAYQNGMVWCFKINVYGEAWIEALMIILYLIGLIILTIARLKNDKCSRRIY